MILVLIARLTVVSQVNPQKQDSVIFTPDSTFTKTIPKDSINKQLNKVLPDSTKTANETKKNKKNALDAPFNYDAKDSIIFDLKHKMVYLYGTAEVKYKDIDLKADYISIDMNNKIVTAKGVIDSTGAYVGSPIFKDGNDSFNADSIKYNLDTKKGIVSGVVTQQGGGYLHSTKTKKLPDNSICLKNGKYTTCDLDHPHFYLALSKARVIPNDKIVAGPSYLVIEDVPIPLGLPFGLFPNNGKHASGIIIPAYGEEENRGFFLRDGGYYFHINDYVDTKVLFDFYTNGSWGVKNITNYKKRYKYAGNFKFDYSKLIRGESFEPNYSETNAYWIKWHHRQDPKARPNSSFSASVNMGSSKFKAYNTTSYNDRMSGSTQSLITYNLRIPNSPFSMAISASQSQNNVNQDKFSSKMDLVLPQITFNMSRIYPLKRKNKVGKTRWYEKIGLSYSTNFKNIARQVPEDTIFTPVVFDFFQNGIKHTIPVSTSMKVLKYFSFSPNFNYNEYWYFKSIHRTYYPEFVSGNDTLTDYYQIDTINGFSRAGDFIVSMPFTTKLYGMYQFKGKEPLIKAIRHVMTPSVSFSWRPDFSDPKWGVYQSFTETSGKEKRYSKFDGGSGAWRGIYGGPPSGKYGSIGFSLNNNLEMKARNRADSLGKGKKIKLLNSLNFSTAYNLAVDSLNWGDVYVRANTSILRKLSMNFTSALTVYDNDSLGRSINTFLLSSKNTMFRLKYWNLSLGLNLNSKGFTSGKQPEITQTQEDIARATGMPLHALYNYSDFSVPWNLNVQYTLNMSYNNFLIDIQEWDKRITQTLRFSGNMSLTEKWKFVFTSGYDLEKHEIAYTSFQFVRDLHCWEMSLNIVPFGLYKSYTFKINVKAAMLKDLALPMRRSWVDNFDF